MPVADVSQWEEARRAVLEGGSYDAASFVSGIPKSTIQKRAAEEGWQEQRAAKEAYNVRVQGLKDGLLKRVEAEQELGENLNADRLLKLLSAWKMAEAAYPELRRIADIPKRVLLEIASKTLRQVVEYLAEHDTVALAALEPHLKGISEALAAKFGG